MVVGWLKEHSMCGQEMEAVTTDNCGMQSYEWVGGACGVRGLDSCL